MSNISNLFSVAPSAVMGLSRSQDDKDLEKQLLLRAMANSANAQQNQGDDLLGSIFQGVNAFMDSSKARRLQDERIQREREEMKIKEENDRRQNMLYNFLNNGTGGGYSGSFNDFMSKNGGISNMNQMAKLGAFGGLF